MGFESTVMVAANIAIALNQEKQLAPIVFIARVLTMLQILIYDGFLVVVYLRGPYLSPLLRDLRNSNI